MFMILDLQSRDYREDVVCDITFYNNKEEALKAFNDIKRTVKELADEYNGKYIETKNSIVLNCDIYYEKYELQEVKDSNSIYGEECIHI
jgi:trehalose-6-phosphatase